MVYGGNLKAVIQTTIWPCHRESCGQAVKRLHSNLLQWSRENRRLIVPQYSVWCNSTNQICINQRVKFVDDYHCETAGYCYDGISASKGHQRLLVIHGKWIKTLGHSTSQILIY